MENRTGGSSCRCSSSAHRAADLRLQDCALCVLFVLYVALGVLRCYGATVLRCYGTAVCRPMSILSVATGQRSAFVVLQRTLAGESGLPCFFCPLSLVLGCPQI
jgi:hypothetical protein